MSSDAVTAKNKELWVDNVKILACILGVLGHLLQSMRSAGLVSENFFFTWFDTAIYFFHVPLFFICSGYLYQKYSSINTFGDWRNNVLKKLIGLGVPYFSFSLITWLIKSVFSDAVNTQVNSIGHDLFVWPQSPYWFLYILFLLFVIVPVFKQRKGMIMGLLLAVVLYLVCTLFMDTDVFILYALPRHLFWFVLGQSLSVFDMPGRQGRKEYFVFASILFAFASVWMSKHDIENAVLSLLMGMLACSVILPAIWNGKTNSQVTSGLSRYTMPVFLMHTICAAGIRVVLLKLGITDLLVHLIFGVVFSFGGPMVAAEIMRRIKWLDFFINPLKYVRINKR